MRINQKGIGVVGVLLLMVFGAIGMMLFLGSKSTDADNSPPLEEPAVAVSSTGPEAVVGRVSQEAADIIKLPWGLPFSLAKNTFDSPKTAVGAEEIAPKETEQSSVNNQKSAPPVQPDMPSVQPLNTVAHDAVLADTAPCSIRGFSESPGAHMDAKKVLSHDEIREIYNKRVALMGMLD